MTDTDQDPDAGHTFPVNEADVEYWSRTIRNELSEVEAVTDAQYIESYVRLELSLHQGLDWKDKTLSELKVDFMLYINFISPT